MKTDMYFWSYLTRIFLKWEIFQTKFLQKIKTHFMFNNIFRKSCRLWDNVEKYGTAGQAKDYNMAPELCILDN
jgi:hypothetical protein